ncbi:MAG: PIG-L deacetylase family protein [Patescibacteria group bacterium]
MKILVIAPHPDDEVLGCGGTIKKHINSRDEVYLCEVTKSYTPDWTEEYIKQEMNELEDSSKFLGIKETFLLNLPAVKLDILGQKKLNDLLLETVKKIKPEILYVPFYGDINSDHRLVSRACLVAARPRSGSSVKKVLAYEVLSATEWGPPVFKNFIPNVYIDISSTIKEKLKALALYKSQLMPYPHPRSLEAIEILAKKRGIEAGLHYAESFMLLKEII